MYNYVHILLKLWKILNSFVNFIKFLRKPLFTFSVFTSECHCTCSLNLDQSQRKIYIHYESRLLIGYHRYVTMGNELPTFFDRNMEKFLINYKPPSKKSKITDENRKQAKKWYEVKRERAFKTEWKIGRPWLYTDNSPVSGWYGGQNIVYQYAL